MSLAEAGTVAAVRNMHLFKSSLTTTTADHRYQGWGHKCAFVFLCLKYVRARTWAAAQLVAQFVARLRRLIWLRSLGLFGTPVAFSPIGDRLRDKCKAFARLQVRQRLLWRTGAFEQPSPDVGCTLKPAIGLTIY